MSEAMSETEDDVHLKAGGNSSLGLVKTDNNEINHVRKQQREGGAFAEDDARRAQILVALNKEKETLDPGQYPHVYGLVQREISRVAVSSGQPESLNTQDVDLYLDPPISVNVRCFPPSQLYPNMNYAGKILGPRGSYLKALMRETKTKMVLLGQGVMKDKQKEAELRKGFDPMYAHLKEEMHVSITVTAPSSEAYERAGYAIACLKRQVLSDNRDLTSLPWIAKVIENGEGPTIAYLLGHSKNPTDPGNGTPSPAPPYKIHNRPQTRYLDIHDHRHYVGMEGTPPLEPFLHPREYYDEYAPRPSHLDKYRETIGRSAMAYTRPRPRLPAPTYDHDSQFEAAASSYFSPEPHERSPWAPPTEGRIRPPAAATRYVPYKKYI